MGTLFDQSPRSNKLVEFYFDEVEKVARAMGYTPEVMSPEEWSAAANVTIAAHLVQTGDVVDEQLAGFGEILENLVAAVKGLRSE